MCNTYITYMGYREELETEGRVAVRHGRACCQEKGSFSPSLLPLSREGGRKRGEKGYGKMLAGKGEGWDDRKEEEG